MSFDRNNPADLLALQNEVLVDPAGVGYASAGGGTAALLNMLNSPEANPGNETAPDYVTVRSLWNALFDVSISSQDQFKIQLVFEASQGLEADVTEFRGKLHTLSANIATALDAITRNLSRAEVLFAELTPDGVMERVVISREDWYAARDYVA